MKNFNVSEVFDSIEGEGKRTGYMSVFVRLTGCNLRCSYCDTKYAQVMGREDKEYSLEELVKTIEKYPWKRVTLTGGEPLLHDVDELVRSLTWDGYEVNIETNGAVPLLKTRCMGMFYTMDWKCPSSGENESMIEDNLKQLTNEDVLKFVVGNREDLEEMKRIASMFLYKPKFSHYLKMPLLYVSPVYGEIDPKEIVEYLKENELDDVCMQIQLHKVIWNPDERGV